MLFTAAKRLDDFEALYALLEKNDIRYELMDDRRVKCFVPSCGGDIPLYFGIDSFKMLVTLYSPVPFGISQEKTADIAVAVCLINNALADGGFCFDMKTRMIYFKMTFSFYNGGIPDSVFEYMLSAAADAVEIYEPKLRIINDV